MKVLLSIPLIALIALGFNISSSASKRVLAAQANAEFYENCKSTKSATACYVASYKR